MKISSCASSMASAMWERYEEPSTKVPAGVAGRGGAKEWCTFGYVKSRAGNKGWFYSGAISLLNGKKILVFLCAVHCS